MTDATRAAELARLLDHRTPLESPEGLNDALRAAAYSSDGDVDRWNQFVLSNAGPAADMAVRLVTLLADGRPTGDTVSHWLHWVELLAEAEFGYSRMSSSAQQAIPVAQTFQSILTEARQSMPTFPGLAPYVDRANARVAELGISIAPWLWLSDIDVDAFLAAGDAGRRNLGEFVAGFRISESKVNKISGLLGSDESLRRALQAAIASATRDVWCTRYTADWSLDVARCQEELTSAAVLLRVGLPSPERVLEVRQHEQGTWWLIPSFLDELVPYSQNKFEWFASSLGPFVSTIHAEKPTPAADVWHGLTSLHRIAQSLGGKRGAEVAMALAQDLSTGQMARALRDANESIETGESVDSETARLVQDAVETRVLMPAVSLALAELGIDAGSLGPALAAADDAHREHASATFLLDPEEYEALLEGFPLVADSWWGRRMADEQRLPGVVLDALLRHGQHVAAPETSSDRIARRKPSERGEQSNSAVSIERPAIEYAYAAASGEVVSSITDLVTASSGHAASLLDRLSTELPKIPGVWLRDDIKAAYANLLAASVDRAKQIERLVHVQPGRVALLLCDTFQRGAVGEFRVWLDSADQDERATWAGVPQLKQTARRVVQDAYRAAAGATPLGAPPAPFSQHRFEVVLPPQLDWDQCRPTVDGRSMGMAAAIAFASCWLDRASKPGIVASCALDGFRTANVEFLTAKLRAVLDLASADHILLLCTKHDSPEAQRLGVRTLGVDDVAEALHASDLHLHGLKKSVYGSTSERAEQLTRQALIVSYGGSGKLSGPADWWSVADRMDRLIRTLDAEWGAPKNLAEHRCLAALAYSHAGDTGAASALLRSMDRSTMLDVEVRALWDIVTVGALIDTGKLDTIEGRSSLANLEQTIAELGKHRSTYLLGHAVGTLGRSLMHSRRLGRALPLLRQAVEVHRIREPHEVARSRVYLAMALRMHGEPGCAWEQLEQGNDELEQFTRPFSEEYEQACRVFSGYERARVLVALERFEEAAELATITERDCRMQWWPRLGLLRTRAWARRMCNRVTEADAEIATMRAIVAESVPAGSLELAERLITEASGYPHDHGEVY